MVDEKIKLYQNENVSISHAGHSNYQRLSLGNVPQSAPHIRNSGLHNNDPNLNLINRETVPVQPLHAPHFDRQKSRSHGNIFDIRRNTDNNNPGGAFPNQNRASLPYPRMQNNFSYNSVGQT
eukprot:UN11580